MRTIILTITLVFLAVSVSAQTYYKLSACGNDPLKYIEKNYEDGESRYIGKTVKYFVDECELTLEDFCPVFWMAAENTKPELTGKITGVYLDFYHENYLYSVCLYFSPPYTYSKSDFSRLEGDLDYDDTWKQKYYDLFKDYKIESLYIHKSKDAKSIKGYRRP